MRKPKKEQSEEFETKFSHVCVLWGEGYRVGIKSRAGKKARS
jgi:hypothetical protein